MKHIFFLTFISSIVIFSSCYKKIAPKAVITIVDEDKKPIPGARVNINSKQAIQKSIYDTVKISDLNGQVLFSTKFECILQAIVTKDKLVKVDYFQMKENETTQKTIILK